MVVVAWEVWHGLGAYSSVLISASSLSAVRRLSVATAADQRRRVTAAAGRGSFIVAVV